MQDIRSFFSRKAGSKVKRKRDDDDDDDFQVTQKNPVKKKSKKGGVIFDSDSDSDIEEIRSTKAKTSSKPNGSVANKRALQSKKTPSPVKKKSVNVADFFGASPVQRSEKKVNKRSSQKNEKSKKPRLELEDHDNDDFQETLKSIDKKNTSASPSTTSSKLADKMRMSKVLVPDTPEPPPQRRSPRKMIKHEVKTPTKKAKIPEKAKPNIKKEIASPSPRKQASKTQTTEENNNIPATPKSNQKSKSAGTRASRVSETSPPGTGEKKKGGGPLYRSFLQREGSRFLGTKELPEGAEGCLEGMSFVITGVTEYFEKDELKTHIEKLGGAVRASISKKTSYLVIGREPGESKTQKAQDMKINILDEDGLYQLISSKPGKKKAKPNKVATAANKEKLKHVSNVEGETKKSSSKPKNQFSWKSTLSQESESQGSEVNSQESLGRLDTKGRKDAVESPVLQMWVDKYKPNNSKQIIGQQGGKSNAKKLTKWLQMWHDNNFGANKVKARSNRDEGFSFKAALLSGPPGVGKTTTAQIVCKEVGFTFYELNASDARSKKTLQQCVSEYLGNTVLGNYFGGKSNVVDQRKHCLIMDEVDGMSGNEDRGGMQELIQLIKGSHVPIICICNDRSHPKIRSLCNYCFDLRFQRPRLPQIKAAMLSVAFKEGVKLPPSILENMILASNQDVRQVLHNMSMWAAGERLEDPDGTTKTDGGHEAVKKDLKVGPWDVLRQVFSSNEEISKMSFNDKVGLFFHDYSIAPLFVQENYPSVIPREAKGDIKKHLDLLSKTADTIANGDLVDRQIRSGMNWKLLPLQAVFASVLPGEYMRGHLGGMINFPTWLGKNSTRGKSHRLLQELQTHMRMSAATSLQSVNQEYLPHLRTRLTEPLLAMGSEGVDDVIDLMNNYDLTREDFDNILELTQYNGFKEPMKSVPSKVKAAFTRTFNKSSHLNPYSVDIGTKAKTKKAAGFEDQSGIEGDTQEQDEEEEDDAAMIAKLKAKTTTKKTSTNSKKGKGPAKGKGKAKGKS